ncbi:hypothetical protein [Myxococcus sp. RHSTA-1-4]|uniref:hypothetical protein n=1 Tax=Myxococcus sp. RHSTA-1-4 TaxID=2874601 RepID=UPI001CBDA622|nr:hypothetical protein [Myxococcus sp. RHSTA-1-4]MBZ4422189.1 hypothetical protein [Myxococcus sp. RHSTA-1-4]
MSEKKKLKLSVETLCNLGGGKRPGQAAPQAERDTPTQYASCTCFVGARAPEPTQKK